MSSYEDRLKALRETLAAGRLDGFVVPLTDEHMSEYVGAYAQRLGWLTGFQGSAGSAVVLPEAAAIFTDGRYTLQVREQVDGDHWEYVSVPATSVSDWLAANAPAGARIGYDPWLHTRQWVESATKALADKGAELVAVDANPVDAIWPDRPQPSDARLTVHEDKYAGRSSAEKRQEMADWLTGKGYDAAVLAALDSIAWTFNIRGADVDRTPVALAYAIVHHDGTADIFVAREKMCDEVLQHLGNGVRVHERSAFEGELGKYEGKRIAVDPERAVSAIFAALDGGGASVVAEREPSVLPKAMKNAVELAGHRAAQARDGAALTRFLHWLSIEATKPVLSDAAGGVEGGGLTEISAAAKLEEFRREHGGLKDLSFDTISAVGPHAAIPHYRVSEESSLPLTMDSIYLVDSGGQYSDGTTDVTRTVIIGRPSEEMRDRFTRVLRGHIALATAIFPRETRGSQLDSFARQYLWRAGLDYMHGTGHGVGSFLAVHEGPQRISAANYPGLGWDEPLKPGMILSNEPGYYKGGEYGIRIENLVAVQERDIPGGDAPMLGFETLTFAPIDRQLIVREKLSEDEAAWVDAYHEEVIEIVGPLLDREERRWLESECAPL
ncbi:MAG: aminopeptidase P family protein [Sphingomonadaceae bacterium]|nr:aminopeptidase P family protein [Sphingomonadaceae bacterium]